MVGWFLGEIEDIFQWSDIHPDLSFVPNVDGQRRALVEQGYHSLDISDPDDVQRLLHAYEDILAAKRRKGEDTSLLTMALHHDGFVYISGQIIREDQAIQQRAALDEGSHLWTEEYARLFLCHQDNDREIAEMLKASLDYYGVTCFVAHRDVGSGTEWVSEIELALSSMNCLVALMTNTFMDSEWTDQEIGIALGRGVPVVSVDLGERPHGFLSRYQSLPGSRDVPVLAKSIYEHLWGIPALGETLSAGLIARFIASGSWRQSRDLMVSMKRLKNISAEQVQRIENGLLKNPQLGGERVVTEGLPSMLEKWKE
jgi:hypothetical protein